MSELANYGAAAGVTILLLDRVFAFIKSQNGKKNGASGELPKEYWLIQFAAIMKEALEPLLKEMEAHRIESGKLTETLTKLIAREEATWRAKMEGFRE